MWVPVVVFSLRFTGYCKTTIPSMPRQRQGGVSAQQLESCSCKLLALSCVSETD